MPEKDDKVIGRNLSKRFPLFQTKLNGLIDSLPVEPPSEF